MHYVRTTASNFFQVGGNMQTVLIGTIEDRAPSFELSHDEAVNLSAWLLGTVLLQSGNDDEKTLDRFRVLVVEASGRPRSPI